MFQAMNTVTSSPQSPPPVTEADARTRLLDAAEKLFAEHGLAATSIRDLAREAGVNVAAINYYFGSKENLYAEMLRHSFMHSGASLSQFEAILAEAQTYATHEAAARAIRLFIREFMLALFESERSHRRACLMAREMSDPSPALNLVIDEYIAPKSRILASLVTQLRPDLRENPNLFLYIASIVGQCLHYRMTLPVTLSILKKSDMTPELLDTIAAHIADFSLKALGVDQEPGEG